VTLGDQGARILRPERSEPKLRQPGRCERPRRIAARREQEHELVSIKAPRHEHQRIRGRLIEPLRIIHHTKQRPFFRRLRQEAEYSQRDRKTLAEWLLRKRESRAQRRRLRWRQPVKAVENRPDDLMEPRKRQLRFRLDPGTAKHHESLGLRDRVLKERRLPSPWLAPNHQHPAEPGTRLCEQAIDHRRLGAAADKHDTMISGRHRAPQAQRTRSGHRPRGQAALRRPAGHPATRLIARVFGVGVARRVLGWGLAAGRAGSWWRWCRPRPSVRRSGLARRPGPGRWRPSRRSCRWRAYRG
jgi:hypothetical protein